MEPAPQSIAEAVARELRGERILWSGSPERWAYARKYWKQALFGIPFTAFAIFWTYQVGHIPEKAGHSPGGFMEFGTLWGLMFVAVGLSILLSPFYAAWSARNVFYVVTERRAIIFEKTFQLKIRSFNATLLTGYERVSTGGRSGSIIFQRTIERSGRGTKTVEVGFIGLPDYAPAEQALDKLASRSAA
jgi:hypothetical protein